MFHTMFKIWIYFLTFIYIFYLRISTRKIIFVLILKLKFNNFQTGLFILSLRFTLSCFIVYNSVVSNLLGSRHPEEKKMVPPLGLIHTRHFGTLYCDKKIKTYSNKKIFLSHRFPYPTKVSSENNVTYLELKTYLGQKKPVAQKYRFIAISFITILCVKMSCVNKALPVQKLHTSSLHLG